MVVEVGEGGGNWAVYGHITYAPQNISKARAYESLSAPSDNRDRTDLLFKKTVLPIYNKQQFVQPLVT